MSTLPADMSHPTNAHQATPRRAPAYWYKFPNKGEVMKFTVQVHVYDVTHRAATHIFNGLGRPFGTGVYHLGIELAGLEWSYASTGPGESTARTGVYSSVPKQDRYHRYRESLTIGQIAVSQDDLDALLCELREEWRGCDYNIMHRNCSHFVSEVTRRLNLKPLPAWVTAISKTAMKFEERTRQVQEGLEAARTLFDGVMSYISCCGQANLSEDAYEETYDAEKSVSKPEESVTTNDSRMSASSSDASEEDEDIENAL